MYVCVCGGGGGGYKEAAFIEVIEGLRWKNVLTKENIPFPSVLRNVSYHSQSPTFHL